MVVFAIRVWGIPAPNELKPRVWWGKLINNPPTPTTKITVQSASREKITVCLGDCKLGNEQCWEYITHIPQNELYI